MKRIKLLLSMIVAIAIVLSPIQASGLSVDSIADAHTSRERVEMRGGNTNPDDYKNDLWLNSNFEKIQIGESYTLKSRRVPQIVDSATTGNTIQPKYNYEIVEGNSVSLEETHSSEMTVTADKVGISIIEVGYEGISQVNKSYLIVEVVKDKTAGNEIGLSTSINVSSYDTIYFCEGETVPYTFHVTKNGAAAVTVKLNRKEVQGQGNGEYTVNLENRSNIIEVTARNGEKSESLFYVIDARKIAINVENLSRMGEPIAEGDQVRVSFPGVTPPVYRLLMPGKFNYIYDPTRYAPDTGGVFGPATKGTTVRYTNPSLEGNISYEYEQNNFTETNGFRFKAKKKGIARFTEGHIVSQWWGYPLGADKQTAPTGNVGNHDEKFSVMPDFEIQVEEKIEVEDTEKPRIAIEGLTEGQILREAKQSISVNVTDNVDETIVPTVSLNGNLVPCVEGKYEFDLEDGENIIKVVAVDASNNREETQIKVIYDGNVEGYATISVEKFTLGQGYLKEPVKVAFYKGDRVSDLIKKYLGEGNYREGWDGISGIKDSSQEEIHPPQYIKDKKKKFTAKKDPNWLSAGDYHGESCWKTFINNGVKDLTFEDRDAKDNDVIRVQFSFSMFAADLTSWIHPANKDELTKKVAEVNDPATKEDSLARKNVRKAYQRACELLKEMESSQEDIDEALGNLKVAMANPDPVELDKENLAKAIEQTINLEAEVYTEASWRRLQDALNLPETTQQEVDRKTSSINRAVKYLQDASVKPLDISEIQSWAEQKMNGIASEYVDSSNIKNEWKIAALGKLKKSITKADLAKVYSSIIVSGKITSRVGDLSKGVMALRAAGIDPEKYYGYNLIEKLAQLPVSDSNIWELGPRLQALATDSTYVGIEDVIAEDVEKILALQSDSGLWETDWGWADNTGIALYALAPYYNANPNVKDAIERAVDGIGEKQRPNGDVTENNSNSLSMVVGGVLSVNHSYLNDPRLVKNGKTMLHALREYEQEGKPLFYYKKKSESGDLDLATEQAFRSLVAYFTEGAVFNFTGTMKNAINAQEEDGVLAKIALQRQIDKAENLLEEEAQYNATEVAALKDAIKKGKDLMNASNVTVDQLGKSKNEIDKILSKMKKVQTPLEDHIYISFMLKGMKKGGDIEETWIGAKTYEIPKGKTVFYIFDKALRENNIEYINTGNYISQIKSPITGQWLAEKDNGPNSGWLYRVNGVHPNVGLEQYILMGNADIVWHYTNDYKKEADFNPNGELIGQDVPEVTLDKQKGDVEYHSAEKTLIITPRKGYKIKEVFVNGQSSGNKKILTGIKVTDKIKIVFEKIDEEKPSTAIDEKQIKRQVKHINLNTMTTMTKRGDIKVRVKIVSGKKTVEKIMEKGCMIEYRFYRSTYKHKKFKKMMSKPKNVYYNTYGKNRQRYYYRTKLIVKNPSGKMIAQTKLNQSEYGCRIWKG